MSQIALIIGWAVIAAALGVAVICGACWIWVFAKENIAFPFFRKIPGVDRTYYLDGEYHRRPVLWCGLCVGKYLIGFGRLGEVESSKTRFKVELEPDEIPTPRVEPLPWKGNDQ